MTNEEIARVAHEVNRAYCRAVGDDSQPAWADTPAWQRESALAGVAAHLAAPLTPEESHQAWYDRKEAEGWTWGRVKDPEKKQHPCMVPFPALPLCQQVKDHLSVAVVAALAKISKLRILFDGPPGPVAGRFVEVEDENGRSVNAGEWSEEPPYWVLTILRGA